MDSMNAPSPPSHSVEDRASRFSAWKLWQVPLFFAGAAAVLIAFLTRGLLAPEPARQLHHHLAEARRLLQRQDYDPGAALEHARQAVESLTYDQGRAAEAFFLLGSAHLAIADQTPPSSPHPGEEAETVGEHRREARRCLQEAESGGLSGDDLNRLHFLLAKIGFQLRDNPAQVIELLKANLDSEDDRAEVLTLLSQAYLRLNPPNVKEALSANKKLREEVPQVGEAILGPAKLAGAKLLLQLNQREDARKTLEKINDQAPPAILAEKNMLLAGLYQEERKWAEAAALWRAVLTDKRVPLTEVGGVLYHLGVCYHRLEQNSAAVEAWSDCLRRSQGEEGQAAALALAELRLHEANPEQAVAMLAQAVAKVRGADDWKNTLLELAAVRDLFEQAMTICRKANRFDLAVRTAELYERVAVPPKAQSRRAELNGDWAKAVQERARSAKDETARKKELAIADELLRQAADAHTEAAKLLTAKNKKAEHLWLSAVCSHEGHDYPRAADKLKEIVVRDEENVERLSEALFLLGEACRNLGDMQSAQRAYKACVERGARFTYRARYQLAMLEIEAGQIDLAVKELEQNILIEHRDSDPEAQEKSRLALCSLLYQSAASLPQYYRRVVQYLEGHLDRFADTPASVRARYQLADSYRQLVAHDTIKHSASGVSEKMSEETFDHFLKLNKRSWTRAAEEFTKLEEQIKNPQLATLLSLSQQVEISFHVAECYFELGEYEKALRKYEELAKKWDGSPHALFALGGTIRCFAAVKDFKQMRQRAEMIRGMLAACKGLTDADRQQWLDWLKIVTAKALPPEDDSKPEQPRTSPQSGPLLEPRRQ
ncbi:MAG: tetratricopeptide repeat protein [Gemmataceae bacterium]